MFFRTIFDEIMSFLNKVLKNTHKEGYIYILLFFIVTVLGFLIAKSLGFIFLLITFWCIYFFRDPERISPANEDYTLSPADGIVVDISRRVPPEETGIVEEMHKVSIFLSVFDVHVNRVPVAGKISKVLYHKGKFLSANLDKASDDNERNTIIIDAINGKFAVVQIAGLIARRIVCTANNDQEFKTGERYGIIKFGSRVDVYIPLSYKIKVLHGQRMVGGETIIAEK